ncbi:MAG: radical SAM protein [Lachnospiraceae bacterium]|nr:radical SAM protein [Lachnospiraceae bacterium]MCM1230744.1 radical SAM protein [Ruminococcus flavefaciens]
MKKLYAELTTKCNLRCPHCNIRNEDDHFNHDEFMKQLREFDGNIILFGGEPTLYPDRLFEVYGDPNIKKKVKSISTNLRFITPEIVKVLEEIKYIGTSWNPHRFTNLDYKIWLANLDNLAAKNVSIVVMITLTGDLFEMNRDEFLNMVRGWNPEAIDAIRFEYLVADGLNKDYYEAADEWQSYIYSHWQSKIPMDVSNIDHWYFDCSEVYTLYPNGELVHGCPNHKRIFLPQECYDCERNGICKPCILQQGCSFPKKLAKLVEEKRNQDEELRRSPNVPYGGWNC